MKKDDAAWRKMQSWVRTVALHSGYIRPSAKVCELGVCKESSVLSLLSPALPLSSYTGVGSKEEVTALRERHREDAREPLFLAWMGELGELAKVTAARGPFDAIVTWSASFSRHMRTDGHMRRLVQWISSALLPGGVWLGCLPDSSWVWYQLNRGATRLPLLQFSDPHRLVHVTITAPVKDGQIALERGRVPSFGTAYTLREYSRQRQEILVHIPSLLRIARLHDLYCLEVTNFTDLHASHRTLFAPVFESLGLSYTLGPDARSDPMFSLMQFFQMFAFEKIPPGYSFDSNEIQDVVLDPTLISSATSNEIKRN